MLRLVVLALLVAVSPARAQLTASEIQRDIERGQTRYVRPYEQILAKRDFMAVIHDAVYHPHYERLKAARAAYDVARQKLQGALAAKDVPAANKLIDDLETAGNRLTQRLADYTQSSASSVELIQIGLGVLAFVVGGGVMWLFKRRRSGSPPGGPRPPYGQPPYGPPGYGQPPYGGQGGGQGPPGYGQPPYGG